MNPRSSFTQEALTDLDGTKSSNRFGVRSLPLAIVCLLLACGGCRGHAPTGGIEITYWEKWTGFEDDAMQAVIDDFNTSQKRIFVKKVGVGEIERKLMLATAGGDPPDVAGVFTGTLTSFSEKGALTPLTKMIERAGIKREDYIPLYWDLCEHHGFMWALPSTTTTVALHWNKKLFREAGLDPDKPPRSLDELEEMSEQLTIVEIKRGGKLVRVRFPELTPKEKSEKNFRLVQLGHDPMQPGWWTPMWIYWFGGKFWDGDRRITANSPENIRAFTWLREQAEKYGVDNRRAFSASFGNFSSPQNPFLAGQIAMILQGVWMYNFIEKYSPGMEWGVAPFPAKDPEGYPLVTLAEGDVLVIPKGARHPREAFEFIRYINTQGPMEKLCLGQRKFSALSKVSEDFMKKHPTPYIQTFIDLARSPNAQYVPRLSIWSEFNDEMSVAVDRVTSLTATPQVALDQVQARMQWKLDRVLRRWDTVKDHRLKKWSDYDAR